MAASSRCCSASWSGPHPSSRLGVPEPGVGEGDVPLVLVDAVVDAGRAARATGAAMRWWSIGGRRRLAGDDERHARLVDQDEVRFVDDGVVERALHDVGGFDDRVVAQEVEAGFLGRDVRDVGGVGRPALVAVEAAG